MDLASRIGLARAPAPVAAAAPEPIRRVDGPIEASRGRPHTIGANEPLSAPAPVALLEPADVNPGTEYAPLPATTREAPAAGEMDLVVTPLPTPDDWHHFELALRRVPGVGPLRIEYYRAGILKLRLRWSGAGRLAPALNGLQGYRVGVLGEDHSTLQIRVTRA